MRLEEISYSAELGQHLRKRLFRRDDVAFKAGEAEHVSYVPLHNCMDDALATWAVHGICLHCQQWSITDGRCTECGRVYREGARGTTANAVLIDAQLRRAEELVHARRA